MAEQSDGAQSAETRLLGWMREQRWFAAKTQALAGVEIIEQAAFDDELSLAVAQVEFANGGHQLYQLLLARSEGERDGGPASGPAADSDAEFDALPEPAHARTLLSAIEAGHELGGTHGRFYFRHVEGGKEDYPAAANGPVWPIGVEQSNSSVVFGDRLVLKLFRRLESGINPDLEMLRFLTAHAYPNIAPLRGWYEYGGEHLAATLGIVQRFMPDGVDGWELALDQIATAEPEFLEKLTTLGVATGQLHSALASDTGDPAFSPEAPSAEAVHLLRATLEEEVEHIFTHLPPDDPRLEPIAGLEEAVRELLTLPTHTPTGYRNIRIHGDYHLGQTLYTPDGWILLDFEGEPARPLTLRRAKRSPLRDVAGMLRSFSYAAWAVQIQRGQRVPDGFEERARHAFLSAYFSEVDPSVLPPTEDRIANLLRIFELEKALYELRYELDNRPEWVQIPVAGLLRLVEAA